MSINLPTQDFTTAQTGTLGSISLALRNRPSAIGKEYPKIIFNNESGCGLSLNIVGSNRQLILPAGAWTKPIDIMNNDSAVDWEVQYVLPNQPVAFLFSTLFWPNEKPLEAIALGNSPIGISGNVQTSNVQSLTNDGSAPETVFIESTPSDQTTSSITIRNTASGFLQVLSAGILRTILNVVRGNATSTKASIQIGDSGDPTITTLYGNTDKIRSDTNKITSDGNGNLTATSIIPSIINFSTGALEQFYSVTRAQQHWTPQTGAAVWHEFITWNGSTTLIPFGIGNAASGIALSSITDSGGLNASSVQTGPLGATGLVSFVRTASSSGNTDTIIIQRIGSFGTGEFVFGIDSLGELYIFDSGHNGFIMQNAQYGTTAGNYRPIMLSNSAGGGMNGKMIWEGTTDPGASAGEGDIWIDG